MKKTSISLIIAGMMTLPTIGTANGFLTVTTVQYVQQCVELNNGKMNIYEATYKCSCVIDELSKDFTRVEFAEASTGFKLRNMSGDRGAGFRDDKSVRSGIGSFQEKQIAAYETCKIRR
ncbi:MAG: hypothetical protein COA83_03330 [Methylophaga sp.]|nr:MAG: hypothetical protein COA83_03330 [Methylophaga sp.]